MLLAYLRGGGQLLKPRYDQGLRSILREKLILEGISMGLDVEHSALQMQLHADFAPLLQPKAAKELMNKQAVGLRNLRYLAEFDDKLSAVQDEITSTEQADLFELFRAMEKAGLVGENAKALLDAEETT